MRTTADEPWEQPRATGRTDRPVDTDDRTTPRMPVGRPWQGRTDLLVRRALDDLTPYAYLTVYGAIRRKDEWPVIAQITDHTAAGE